MSHSTRSDVLSGAPTANKSDLDAMYRRYRDTVYRYVARNFGLGPPDPEDVVQVAFEHFANLPDASAVANPLGFLMRSARNHVFDQRRRLSVRAAYAESAQHIADETDDQHAERVLLAKEQWHHLEAAIENLDERRRRMLILNRIQGISYAEIAREYGCSATLVKMLIAEALATCQRALRRVNRS